MPAPVQLIVDLGDLLTKVFAEQSGRDKRLRFPSVVAHRLIDKAAPDAQLLLDERNRLDRLSNFDPRKYPRTRSYPTAGQVLTLAKPVPGARFAGWLAAKLGADRQLLGRFPEHDLIDALLRKALIQLKRAHFDCREVRVRLVVDFGAKADALVTYAKTVRRASLMVHNIRHPEPQRVDIALEFEIADAADCASRALPPELRPDRMGHVALIDIGYLRSKLAVLTPVGCSQQQQADGLGVSDCVRRLLRDEQENGLIEDELAVVYALERSQEVIAVAGREFPIARTLAVARRAVVEELAAAVKRVALAHYQAHGEACSAVAVIGGGAALLGRDLVTRVKELEIGMDASWIADDPSYTLIEGARRHRG